MIRFEGELFADQDEVRRYCRNRASMASDGSREQMEYSLLALDTWDHEDDGDWFNER